MLWGRGEITSFSNHSVSYQHHPLKTCHQRRPCQPDPTPGLCYGPLRSRQALRGCVAKCTAFPSELPESRCESRAPDSSPNQGKEDHGFLFQPSVWVSRVTPCPGHSECTHTAHSTGWSPHPGNPGTWARVVTRAGPGPALPGIWPQRLSPALPRFHTSIDHGNWEEKNTKVLIGPQGYLMSECKAGGDRSSSPHLTSPHTRAHLPAVPPESTAKMPRWGRARQARRSEPLGPGQS